jgi:hypothetical protein
VRCLAEPADDVGCDDAAGAGEEPLRVLRVEAAQLKLLESRSVEGALLTLAHREQNGSRIGNEPFHGEDERIARRDVDPLGVVDDDEERARFGGGGQQAQRGGANREAVLRPRLAEAQGALERLRLLRWDLVEVAEERAEQLQEPGEGKLGFVLHSERAHDRHALGALGGIVEQGRLAEARLTAKHERAATPPSRALEQFVDTSAVGFPTDEHAFTVAHSAVHYGPREI